MPTSASRKWAVLFGCWILFLSGGFANFVGSPGVLQAIRLKILLDAKRTQLSLAQDELQKLQIEATLLENNRYAQIREIHRVLGYAASDEMIFDFTHTDQ